LTFKDLKKRLSVLEATTIQQSKIFDKLCSKPFWIWDIQTHKQQDIKTKGNCCFNHIIGLPTKDQIEKPIYDYQKLLHDSSLISEFSNPLNHNFKHKHLWVKKATGLGVTEFFLRFMAWLCRMQLFLNITYVTFICTNPFEYYTMITLCLDILSLNNIISW
jgi:hypothetical protein